jgi:hypothetical protein
MPAGFECARDYQALVEGICFMKEVIETRSARIWLGDDGIARSRGKVTENSTVEDARDFVSAFAKLANGKARPLLADIREMKSISKEVRNFFANDEQVKMITASALIVGSPVSRLIGNFFLGLNKPNIPVRLFDSEEEAVEWLQGYME